MNIKERMLTVIKGETPDVLPFSPRLDMWYTANNARNTLPKEYEGKTVEDICRMEGWGIYRLVPDLRYLTKSAWDVAMSSIGLYFPEGMIWKAEFSKDIEIDIKEGDREVTVNFRTPVGELNSYLVCPEQMEKDGITHPWLKERPIKTREDWKILRYIFENITVVPDNESYEKAVLELGNDGLVTSALTAAAGPMHHIQRVLFDPSTFFRLYKENYKELEELAASIAHVYDQLIKLAPKGPAEVLFFGGNFDETLTFPPYFEKDILPWFQKLSTSLKAENKFLITHTDGENSGLMDLILQTGIDGAESVCPYPITKLKLDEYYSKWGDQIAILGGIPAEFVIPENASDKEFKSYLDYMLKAVAPGSRFLAGVTDGVPIAASIDRLRQIRDWANTIKMPLEMGPIPNIFKESEIKEKESVAPVVTAGDFEKIQQAMLEGSIDRTVAEVEACVEKGLPAEDILNLGMIKAMDAIGEGFSANTIFIPEMLAAARAMEAGVALIKNDLASGSEEQSQGRVVLGTVAGDLHDIGKNLVAIMLRGTGFEVIDLGINVAADTFIKKVAEEKADILALSALLTTTMPEMQKVIDSLTEAGLRSRVKIIIGGAPITDKFAQQIGADGFAPNAGEAVKVAKSLLS